MKEETVCFQFGKRKGNLSSGKIKPNNNNHQGCRTQEVIMSHKGTSYETLSYFPKS